MLISTDKLDKKDVLDKSDMGYTSFVGGHMSRLLMNLVDQEKVKGLLAQLKGTEKQTRDIIEIKRTDVHEIVDLVELLLAQNPIVLEKDLSPAEAGEIAGISRTSIMNMLKTGRLKGYEVGTHWRITKESLLQYMSDRESFGAAMAEMDKHGFGID